MEGNGKGIVVSASEAMIRVEYDSETKRPEWSQILGSKNNNGIRGTGRKRKQGQNDTEGVTGSVEW